MGCIVERMGGEKLAEIADAQEAEKQGRDECQDCYVMCCLKYECTRPAISFFCCFRITIAGLPATSYIDIKSCVIIHKHSKLGYMLITKLK